MAAFVYRAREPGGQIVKGKAEAESEQDLVARLRNQGLLILEVGRDRDLGAMMQTKGLQLNRRLTGKDLAVFARQFATMINAGLPVVTALKVITRQSVNRRLASALTQIAADVEAGESLSNAFARQGKVFPTVMVQMIAAGEVGGILDEVLERLAVQVEKEENIRQKVRSALVYPGIISIVAVLVVVFLMSFVVPNFVSIYQEMNAQLPGTTQVLIAVSSLVQHYWWAGLLLAAGAGTGFRLWLRTDEGAAWWSGLVLRLPIVGPMVSKQAIGRIARTLGGLLSSGITILKALAVVERTVGNRMLAASLREALEAVRQGQRLTDPLRRAKLYPPMVLEMVSVGEETGTVEEMLGKIADFYDAEVERSAERLSSTIEPVIIVFLAVVVGAIVISMMLPIFNLWTAIQ